MNQRVKLASIKPEARREDHNSHKQKTDLQQFKVSPVGQILSLQKAIGNQAVARLIKSGTLQTKLKIGQPGDIYEKEADMVAEQVMRMPRLSERNDVSKVIQRSCPKCEKEKLQRQEKEIEEAEPLVSPKFSIYSPPPIGEKEEKLHRKASNGCNSEVCPKIQSKIDNLRGGGQPLPESTRAFLNQG